MVEETKLYAKVWIHGYNSSFNLKENLMVQHVYMYNNIKSYQIKYVIMSELVREGYTYNTMLYYIIVLYYSHFRKYKIHWKSPLDLY